MWSTSRLVVIQTDYSVVNKMQIRASMLWTLALWNYLTYLLTFVHTTNYQQPTPEDMLYPPDAVQRYVHTEPGSYFGYSVACYVGQSQSFCLVGSPRAKSDDLGDQSGPASSHSSPHTGLVYRIDLDPNLPYCSVVPIATTDEMRQEAGTPYPGFSSWLGGTVAAASNSLDGIQLGCDPRYIYAPEPINRTASGDTGPSQPRTYLGTGQCALYTGASLQYTSVDACYSQEEGACLAGFSADVEPGKQLGEALVALGMPGSYLTEGNVFLGHYRGRELINAMRLKSSPQDLKHMGFNLGYAVSLVKLVRDTDSRTSHRLQNDASGKTNNFHETNDDWGLLASSSMWIDNEYRGIVMLIDQTMELGGITYLKDQWGHIGSFFGYSLATADLDGNGMPDIIVGAPYFTGQKGEEKPTDQEEQMLLQSTKSNRVRDTLTESIPLYTDSNFTGEQPNLDVKWGRLAPDIGRVYVFYGYPSSSVTNNHLLNKDQIRPDYLSRSPIVLSGLKMIGGRFGHSLVNLGDVDGDGTEDLAISCPYCADADSGHDKGAVLIYLGRENAILDDSPFQILWPGDIPRVSPIANCGDFGIESFTIRPFKSFGWSLSAGTDLDGNHAPDLVIGDFDSDQIVLMRARNTLWFDSPEWDLPTTRTLPWSGPDETPCGSECRFHVRLSVAVHGNRALLQQHHHRQPQHAQSFKLHVIIDLDASMENLVFKRLSGRELTNISHPGLPVNGIMHTVVPVTLTPNELGDTDRLTLLSLALEPQSARVRSFLWKPIVINASLLPVSDTMPNLSGSRSVASWMLHPFLGKRYFLSRPLQFANPACGPDNICRADLRVRMMDISDGPTDNQVVYFRERITQRNLTVGIGNLGENAYAAQLRMTIPHHFSFTLPDDLSCQSRLLPTIQATQILCDLGDPLGHTGSDLRPFVFHLNTAGAFRELDVPLHDQPESAESGNFSNPQITDSVPQSVVLKRFEREPFGLQTQAGQTSVHRDSVIITAEVISGNEDEDLQDNVASITYNLQLTAKIELSSSSLDRTTIDSRNFTVQLYEMQRVHPETLGPEIKHIYLISNNGPSPIEDLWVNISMPMQTEDGEHLVYFLDRVRHQVEDGAQPLMVNKAPEVISAEGHVRGVCLTPEWALNPLRLNAVQRGHLDFSLDTSRRVDGTEDDRNWQKRVKRLTRSVTSRSRVKIANGAHSNPESENGSSKRTAAVRAARSILPGIRKRQQEIVKCGQEFANLGMPICATVQCRIDLLSRGDAVRIVLRGYVWADTFFRHKISDLAIVSEAKSELPSTAFGIPVHGNRTIQPLAISQNFVFHGIQIPLFREIPLWPIILGGVLGAILLTLIIIGMWRCGFFRRRRWYDNAAPNTISMIPTDL